MNANVSKSRNLPTFILLLFGLSIPFWVIGAKYDVQIFPGFNLFQLPLTMPAVAALLLITRERGRNGVVALLKRTYDFRNIKSKIWYLPILLIYPSIGLLDYLIQRISGISMPSLHFSLPIFLGYSMVFFLTYGEELGLTGYAVDRNRGTLSQQPDRCEESDRLAGGHPCRQRFGCGSLQSGHRTPMCGLAMPP